MNVKLPFKNKRIETCLSQLHSHHSYYKFCSMLNNFLIYSSLDIYLFYEILLNHYNKQHTISSSYVLSSKLGQDRFISAFFQLEPSYVGPRSLPRLLRIIFVWSVRKKVYEISTMKYVYLSCKSILNTITYYKDT